MNDARRRFTPETMRQWLLRLEEINRDGIAVVERLKHVGLRPRALQHETANWTGLTDCSNAFSPFHRATVYFCEGDGHLLARGSRSLWQRAMVRDQRALHFRWE